MKSILVIGLGRFGRHMAIKLIEENNRVLAIEKNEERAEMLVDRIPDIQIGDTTDEAFIRSLGVDNFDICVVAIGDGFQTALETIVLLKDYGAKYVIARATRDVHRKLLLRNGADYVVYAEKETAERLAVKFGAKNIFDYIELTDEVGVYEIAVPKHWVGSSIIEKDVRRKCRISILAIKKEDVPDFMPDPTHIFEKDETLMVLGTEEDVRRITD